jgi:hypothetical protein
LNEKDGQRFINLWLLNEYIKSGVGIAVKLLLVMSKKVNPMTPNILAKLHHD